MDFRFSKVFTHNNLTRSEPVSQEHFNVYTPNTRNWVDKGSPGINDQDASDVAISYSEILFDREAAKRVNMS